LYDPSVVGQVHHSADAFVSLFFSLSLSCIPPLASPHQRRR